MIKKINIAITEDHDLMRQGMIALLKEEEGINILFDVGNGRLLLDKLKITQPDIILLDIAMPEMDGKEAIEIICKLYPKIKVIIISTHYNDTHIAEMIMKGARGFLPKACDIEKVVDAIYSVYDTGFYFDNKVSKSLVHKLQSTHNINSIISDNSLSEREVAILKLICQEKSNQEISDLVFLSKRTVEWHKNNILAKTKSKNIVGLVKYAIRHKIIPDTEDLY